MVKLLAFLFCLCSCFDLQAEVKKDSVPTTDSASTEYKIKHEFMAISTISQRGMWYGISFTEAFAVSNNFLMTVDLSYSYSPMAFGYYDSYRRADLEIEKEKSGLHGSLAFFLSKNSSKKTVFEMGMGTSFYSGTTLIKRTLYDSPVGSSEYDYWHSRYMNLISFYLGYRFNPNESNFFGRIGVQLAYSRVLGPPYGYVQSILPTQIPAGISPGVQINLGYKIGKTKEKKLLPIEENEVLPKKKSTKHSIGFFLLGTSPSWQLLYEIDKDLGKDIDLIFKTGFTITESTLHRTKFITSTPTLSTTIIKNYYNGALFVFPFEAGLSYGKENVKAKLSVGYILQSHRNVLWNNNAYKGFYTMGNPFARFGLRGDLSDSALFLDFGVVYHFLIPIEDQTTWPTKNHLKVYFGIGINL